MWWWLALIRYCIDYQDQEKPEYLALLEDAGSKLEHKGIGWQLPIYISVIDNLDQSRFGPFILVFWALLIAVLAGIVIGMAVGNRKFRQGKSLTK